MEEPTYLEENSKDMQTDANEVRLGELLDLMQKNIEERQKFKLKSIHLNSNRTGLEVELLPSANGALIAQTHGIAQEIFAEHAEEIEELTK